MKGVFEKTKFVAFLIALLLTVTLYGQKPLPQPAVNNLGCNWGYKVGDKWLVEPIFDIANAFSYADSVAIVRLGEYYGMIDLNGKMLIDLEADEIHLLGKTRYSYNNVINGYYVVKKGDSVGLYSVSAKKMMFKLIANEIKTWHKPDSLLKLEYQSKQKDPSSGRVYVTKLIGIANLNDVLIYPSTEYLAPTGNHAYVFSRNEQYYLASDKGKQLSQKGYDFILPYWQNGFYVVEKNGYQGLIDDKGNEVLLPEWYLYNFGSDYKRPSNHVSSLNYNRYL
ncbi:MAG: WG repeat-containing protein, partial [Bacteroidia bacterium]